MPKGRPLRNPNGYGSIVKLSGRRRKPFEVRVNTRMDDRNYPVYDVLGRFEERPAALAALAKYNENPYDLNINELTFEDVYQKWYKRKFEISQKKLSASSLYCCQNAYKKSAKLHKMKFKDIRTFHMQEIIDDRTLSRAYIEHIVSLYKQMFKYALEFDIAPKDYAAFLTITKQEDDEPGVPFSREELDLLWQNKDKPFVDSVLIFIYTGWRVSELLPMKREDIDLDARTMIGGIKTAAGKNRVIPIHSKIYEMVTARMSEGYPVLFGIGKRALKRKETFYPFFNDALQAAGIKTKHTPHDCRHTFATLLDNAGANPISIKHLMGHAGTDVTEKVYTHKDIEELRKAIELI